MSVSEDEPPTKEELEAAAALAEQVDDVLAGTRVSPLVQTAKALTEERELAELGSMIHASFHPPSLDAARQSSIIDAALAKGAGIGAAPLEIAVNEIAAAREKRRARWPIAVGGLVAAAAIALLVWRVTPQTASRPSSVAQLGVPQLEVLPETQTSRSADAEIGQIAPRASGAASTRLDDIYGGRSSGYRALRYRKLVGTR